MSDPVLIALVASLPPTLLALATLVVAFKAAKNIQKVELATNSMKDALVAATEAEALARGIKQGKRQERAEPGSI